MRNHSSSKGSLENFYTGNQISNHDDFFESTHQKIRDRLNELNPPRCTFLPIPERNPSQCNNEIYLSPKGPIQVHDNRLRDQDSSNSSTDSLS